MKPDNNHTHRECLMQYMGKIPPEYTAVLDCEIESADAPYEGGGEGGEKSGMIPTGIESTYFFRLGNAEIGCICTLEEAHTINIFNVYIEPDYRGQGFSREMLYSVLEDIIPLGKKILLQVADNNEPAFSLYTKCGFEIIDSVVSY